ncbi:MAG: NAD(P) transhydrogenase subunit alpha [Phycisphaeraceae bacterium]
MQIFVPRQTGPDERRVALTPAAAKKLVESKAHVTVQTGAGLGAGHADDAYTQVGAAVLGDGDADKAWADADIVLTMAPPTPAQAGAMKQGTVLVGLLAPLKHKELMQTLAGRGVTAVSMEFVPRISRAQAMDVLSSQANLGGYKAVLLAAHHLAKAMPMMMTAAGTIAPARVLVIGAGVAGLQAIATARRLGAVVEAYDVRPVVKEQVQSLGARFVELPMKKTDAEAKGGYAKEQSDEERRQQAELMAKHVIGADAVVTTAAIFGKAPPMLIPAAVVAKMSAGSVIVDLAADADAGRGNCQVTQPGKVITTENGVIIDGTTNLPSLLSVHASQVYAQNMLAYLKQIVIAPAKDAPAEAQPALKIDLSDEVQKGATITHDGAIVNAMVSGAK